MCSGLRAFTTCRFAFEHAPNPDDAVTYCASKHQHGAELADLEDVAMNNVPMLGT
jgi:hypothetical protein